MIWTQRRRLSQYYLYSDNSTCYQKSWEKDATFGAFNKNQETPQEMSHTFLKFFIEYVWSEVAKERNYDDVTITLFSCFTL